MLEWFQTNTELAVAVIALSGAVFGTIAGVISALLVANRSTYISSVTAERSRWIEKLRSSLAELLGLGSHILLRTAPTQGGVTPQQDIDRLIAQISLQLNPNGSVDRNIITLLRLLPRYAETQSSDYRKLEQAIIRHSQFLLKEEWEKVKSEAMGWWAILQWSAHWQRQADYEEFCKTNEAMPEKLH